MGTNLTQSFSSIRTTHAFQETINIVIMKTIFAIFALLAVTCYAAPALEKSKTLKYEYDVPLTKGEAHMQNEPEGKFWIPFWDYVTGWFSKKQELPTSNNEMKMAKPVEPTYLPNLNKDDYEDSHEFLEEINNRLFTVKEETQELKEVHSDEVRYMNYKTPEHVRDAVIHGKVNVPKRRNPNWNLRNLFGIPSGVNVIPRITDVDSN